MPTKSAIAGMCCASLGYSRGSVKEENFLVKFLRLRMTSIAIPRKIARISNGGINETELKVGRLQDYHTVMNTRKADGGIKDCHITHRQYVTDAGYGVLLEGETNFLKNIANGLADPVWGIWLGRKTCIPTSPVLCGLEKTKVDALRALGIENVELFTRQEDVDSFAEGIDSLLDSPMSFSSEKRLFAPRRVKTVYAK